jgi:hypothetical protein
VLSFSASWLKKMAKVVLGDTSAIIQLAIISVSLFASGKDLEIIILPRAMEEIKGIYGNKDANPKIKPFLKQLIDTAKTSAKYLPPTGKAFSQLDQRIQSVESAMNAPRSAPTDSNDRLFLIVAKHNDLCFCTREGSLHSLAKIILGIEKAWGVSKVLEYAVTMNVISKRDAQTGLDRLTGVDETLHIDCRTYLKDLGYKI